jgi:hypothetical protein
MNWGISLAGAGAAVAAVALATRPEVRVLQPPPTGLAAMAIGLALYLLGMFEEGKEH